MRAELRADGRTPRGGRRGFALILVLVAMIVVTAFNYEFAYKVRVSRNVSSNLRDEVIAYYHARAAMEVARLVIKSQNVLDNMFNTLAAFIPNAAKQKANVELWKMSCEFANAFCTGELNLLGKPFFNFKGREGVGVEKGGECWCEPSAEDGKTAINRVDTPEEKSRLFMALYRAMIAHRKEPLLPGEFDKEIAEQVAAIIDYADLDTERSDLQNGVLVSTPSPEGANYKGDIRPKNAKFDSLEELKLVPGIEPHIFCRLAEKLTPYFTQKLNVNEAPLDILRQTVCDHTTNALEACYSGGTGGLALPTVDLGLYCMGICVKLRQSLLSPGFVNINDFLNFFDKLPAEWQPRPQIDKARLGQVVGTKSRVIRVTTTGRYYTTVKKLTAVIDTATGNYVYWREY